MADEPEIKELLSEVLGRLSTLESEGKEAHSKLDALTRRVNLPVFPIPISLRDQAGETAGVAPPPSAPEARNEVPVQENREGRSPGTFQSISPGFKPVVEPGTEPVKVNPPKPRIDRCRRPKKVQVGEPVNSPGLALNQESILAIKALLEILVMNASEDDQAEGKVRVPAQRNGKFVLRTVAEDGKESKANRLVFEIRTSPSDMMDHSRMRLVTAAAIVMLGILVGGGFMVGLNLSPRLSARTDEMPIVAPTPPLFTVQDSKKALETFLTASSLEEAVAQVYQRDGQTIERMREYYARPGSKGWEGEIMDPSPVSSQASGGRIFHLWRVKTPGGFMRIAPLYRDETRVLLYWEGFTGYGAMDWNTFVNNRPEEPVEMRVFLEKINNALALSGDALALEVSHPDSDFVEIVNITDETMRMLLDMSLQGSSKPIRATVEMGYIPDETGAKSLRITSFIGTGWGEDMLVTTPPTVAAKD